MLTARVRADIVVRDADGRVLAVAEVKNRQGLTPEIAATLRRNLIAHGLADWEARFFLLVSQETGYLWDQEHSPPLDAPLPNVSFPMAPVVVHYLPSLIGNGRLSGSQLELAVTQWLWDLANDADIRPHEPEIPLAGTGFPQLIRGSFIDSDSER